MNTKTALNKLTDKQKDRLDLYAYQMNVDKHKANSNPVYEKWARGYAGLLDGYLNALEDMGVLTLTECRLVRVYFADKTKKEVEDHEN